MEILDIVRLGIMEKNKIMTKEDSLVWSTEMCESGTYEAQKEYKNKHDIGGIAERVWNDPLFTYGIEYGILIAVDKIFNLESTKENK